MPTRRNMLLGAGALVAGGGAVLGTGAFTSVQAERTVEVQTANDSGAFLGLQSVPNSENSADYTSTSGGTLEVNIDGVNLNAITHIDEVFRVVNNGSQPVVVYFEERPGSDNPDGNAIDVGARTDELTTGSVPPSQGSTSNGIKDTDIADLSSPTPPDQGNTDYAELGVKLDAGEALDVGLYIDTSDDNLNDGLSGSGNSDVNANEALMENVVIWADADAAQNSDYQFVEANSSP